MSSLRTGRVGRWFCICALAGLFYASNVRADFVGLLNVDFGEASPTFNGVPSMTYSGAAVVGTAGDVWNGPKVPFSFGGHQSASGIALVNSAGAATGVMLGYDVTGAYKSAPGTSAFDGTTYDDLMNDYLYDRTDTAAPGMVTLSGLTANGAYDLYLYSEGDVGKETIFTVNGTVKIASTLVTDPPTLVEGVNYVKYSATADGSGNLAISFTASAASFDGVLNGLQLSAPTDANAVPLPPVFFTGLATLGLAWPARRWLGK